MLYFLLSTLVLTLYIDVVLSLSIPKTSPFPKRKAKPWFDEDCQTAKKERNKANRLANKYPSAANSMRARLIQARTKKLFKQKKRDSWKNYVSSVNVNTPSKKVWNVIRKITGKNVASPMHHLKDNNGTLITDRVEIANTLGAAIEKSSSSENYSKEFQFIKAQKEKHKINFKTNRNLHYNKKFTMRDLKRSLKKSNNSSPGPDQIHYEILRHLPIEILHILWDIINETWKSDTFTESRKEALIISVPKPGKDHFNPLNYRPIALTSCICKTVERMVNERLVWYLEKNGLLAKQQCGYRANRSTVDHLVRLETFIRDAFIQNQHLVAVFFDLQKAYDTTWKHGILKDLHDMGLRGNLPIFIGNFLSDRTFQVHLGTILSDVFHQEEGVCVPPSACLQLQSNWYMLKWKSSKWESTAQDAPWSCSDISDHSWNGACVACIYLRENMNSIMMLVKFLTSANQKHWIWSCGESGLCNPWLRLLGDEVVDGSSLMSRKMDTWNVIRKHTAGQD